MTQPEVKEHEEYRPLQNISLEASRERVETLWRQTVGNKSTGRSELAAARSSRARAEMEKQRISCEALESTSKACDDLIVEAERQLISARQFESEGKRKLAEAEDEWKQAQMARAEADGYREKVQGEADQEAQRIRDEARSAAMNECEEIKRHVASEVQAILSEIDAKREAAQEELEAQRIYTEAANLKGMSRDIRAEVMGRVESAVRGHNQLMEAPVLWETPEARGQNGHGEMGEWVESAPDGQHNDDMPPQDIEGGEDHKSPRNSKKGKITYRYHILM